MRKAFRSLFRFLVAFVIGVGCVAALLSGLIVIAMLIGWMHDGKLHSYERPVLIKAVFILVPSVVVTGVMGWIYRRFNPKDAESFRLLQSQPTRLKHGSILILLPFAGAFGSVMWGMIPPGPWRVPILAMWMVVGVIALHAHILLHELGHFLAAWGLSFRFRALYVGTGPLLASIPLARGQLIWRMCPSGGFVNAFDSRHRNRRLRQTIFIAGGPIMDALVLLVSYRLITMTWGNFGLAFAHSTGSFVASILFFWVLFIAIGGVIPQTVMIGERKLKTDGALLVRTWLAPKGAVGFTGDPSWLEALPLLQSAAGNGKPAGWTGSQGAPGISFRDSQSRLRSRLRPTRA